MNKLILLLTLCIFCFACHEKPKQIEGGYLLTVTMKDYSEPYIYYWNNEKKDSIAVKENQFYLTGKLQEPSRMRFTGETDKNKYFIIYVENSIIDAQVDFTKDRFNDPNYLKVTGSKAHTLEKRIDRDVFKYSDQKYKGASKMALAKYKTNGFYGLLQNDASLINNVSFDKAYGLFTYGLSTKFFPYDEATKLLDVFKNDYGETKQFRYMEAKLGAAKKRKIGAQFIDYTIKDTKDNNINIQDYYGSSYILIDIWASWCGPCRKENPNYKKALKLYENKGFNIVAVSLDNEKQRWLNAIHEDRTYNFIHASELKGRKDFLSKTYGINGIPDNFLLDKEGKIVANSLRGEDLIDTLDYLYTSKE